MQNDSRTGIEYCGGDVNHPRDSLRLQGYNYTGTGAYFITTCTQQKLCLFGEIAGWF